MTAAYMDAPPLNGTLRRQILDAVYRSGIDVRVVDMVPCQCEWCGDVDAYATVRVYGQPRAEVLAPVELVEVCDPCAADVVARAIGEARDDAGDIVIEVSA